MKTAPLMLSSFPKAVLHVDGDAFFTSVEQALHPALRGKPLVTGSERGIIACASYEAKALGIKRGVSLYDARRICPALVILPSDYENYSIFSKRMFEIMRRFTPEVEEYSIDEGFADITGMRSVFRCSYKEIAQRLQQTIKNELDLSVSIGLSLTKSLAKIASDFRKPEGLTAVPGHSIHLFLDQVPLCDVWGLGPNRVNLLNKHGLKTAFDYIQHSPEWIKRMLHKPGVEIWHELRGQQIMPLNTNEWTPEASISKTKTFSAPSDCRDYVYARLLRNIESAFIKLRRHRLRAKEISVCLRQKDYHQDTEGLRLKRPASVAHEVMPEVRAMFERLYKKGKLYRATGVILLGLERSETLQYELFEDTFLTDRTLRLGETITDINSRYGKHRIFMGTGLHLAHQPVQPRDEACWRRKNLLKGETERKRIGIPLLDIEV